MTESAASHVSQGNADGVSLRHVSKTYGLATVLQVDELTFRNGEVTGLVGENGAGKSTMLGILAGTVTPDPGGDGGHQRRAGARRARRSRARRPGVAMVSQEFPLVGQLSVAENLTLGMRPEGARGFFYDRKSVAAAARGMLERVGLDVDPHAPVSTLSIPARQLLEVAKALGRNPRLLILDEPTSALGPVEADLVIRHRQGARRQRRRRDLRRAPARGGQGGRRPGGRAAQRQARRGHAGGGGDRRPADQGDGRPGAPGRR